MMMPIKIKGKVKSDNSDNTNNDILIGHIHNPNYDYHFKITFKIQNNKDKRNKQIKQEFFEYYKFPIYKVLVNEAECWY